MRLHLPGNIFATLSAALVIVGCGSGEGQLFEKTIPAPSLRGNAIGEPAAQPIAVYLPPGYASTSDRYPVIYLLPGYNTGVTAFLDGTYQGMSLVESMDALIANGTVDEMIIVVVNGGNLRGDSTEFADSWERFLVRDVVRYVDRHYKTLAYREKRGIAGHSTGATAALRVAMRHPNAYSAFYAMAPVWSDDVDNTIRSYPEEKTKLRAIAIEIGSGEADKPTREGCEHLSDRLSETGIAHQMIVFEGKHEDLMRQRLEENVLPFFSGAFGLE